MQKIYLAIPYTGIEELSFKVANYIAAKLMNEGNIVFSPISHSHHIAAQNELESGWDYWKKFDESFIGWCDIVAIVMLIGWERSKGVNGEIDIADSFGKPITYIDPKQFLYVQNLLIGYNDINCQHSQADNGTA